MENHVPTQSITAETITSIEAEISRLIESGYGFETVGALNNLITAARDQIKILRNLIAASQVVIDSDSLKLTSHYLKYQSRLAIAVGRAVKHIGEETRKRSALIRARKTAFAG